MAKDVKPGKDQVPALPRELSTPVTELCRQKYIDAWDAWRGRRTMANAAHRDRARQHFYAEVGRKALDREGDF